MNDSTKESLTDFFYHTMKIAFELSRLSGSYNHVGSVLRIGTVRPRQVYNLFLQESTRTRELFRVAGERLGAVVHGVIDPQFSSSIKKGETLEATVRTLARAGYDAFVIRYRGPKESAAQDIADMCEEESIPASIICAGENNTRHPVQALCDLYTVFHFFRERFLRGDLHYVIIGDLSDSRTIHDFLYGISFFGAQHVSLVSEKKNNIPPWVEERLRAHRISFTKVFSILPTAPVGDVFYFTRYQGEYRSWMQKMLMRPFQKQQNRRYAERFGASKDLRKILRGAPDENPPHVICMHPLPHGPELGERLHLMDKRFVHYRMIDFSLYTKAALLWQLLNPRHTLGSIPYLEK